jgi:DNA repair ATPase RecN
MDPDLLGGARRRMEDRPSSPAPATAEAPLFRLPPRGRRGDEREDLAEALALVEGAARTIDHLQAKSDRYESLAKSLIERTKQQMSSLAAELADWRRKAEQSNARAAEAERRLAEAEARADDAERLAHRYDLHISDVCESVTRSLSARCADFDAEAENRDLDEIANFRWDDL